MIWDRITQADITTNCVFTFLRQALGVDPQATLYPSLAALSERCEALPVFRWPAAP